jgi:hypothetical protein
VAGSSLLAAAPLAAQMTGGAATPSVFRLTPHVGFTTYTDIVELPIHDDGSDPSFPFDGTLAAKLDGQLTFGATGEYQSAASPWGAFVDFSRSGGDGKFALRLCDPDFGCETTSLEATGSQWRASAGVTRRFAFGAASTATLSLGALYGKTHFEADESGPGVSGLDESSPGAVIGGSLDFPFSPRVGIRLQLRDALMRVSGESFARELNDALSGTGIVVESEDKFVNAFNFGVGAVLRW